MRVLGVDPGVARTGVAVVEGEPGHLGLVHAACLETPAGDAEPDRLAALFAQLEAVVGAHRPEAAAVEQLFFATNRRSAMRVSQARGVALCALARAGVTVAEYTPLQVKEAVAGWGGAGKAQVGRMTRTLLGVDEIPGPDDVADAAAIAVCHLHRARLAGQVAAAAPRRSMSPSLAAAVARARAGVRPG